MPPDNDQDSLMPPLDGQFDIPSPQPQPSINALPAPQPTAFVPSQPDSSPTPQPAAPVPPAHQWQPPATMPEAVAAPQAGAVVSFHATDSGVPGASVAEPKAKGHKFKKVKKPALILLIVLVVLGGGSAAAYFGYYMNPNTIWKQSLGNTSKGYDKLTGYLNTQSGAHYSGAKETGSFKVISGDNNYDGSLNAASDGSSSTVSAKLDLGVAKLDVEERSVKAAGATTPDDYLQLSGIKGLGDYLGTGDLGPQINGLDGKWIVIDHNLIADLKQRLNMQQSTKSSSPQLTWNDINSFLQAAGKVNKQYVFTTNKKTSVTKIVKNYGQEKLGGHKTYHYKVGFVNANVKAYVTAMCSALQASDLGSYIKQESGQAVASSSTCKDLEKSADNIKSSDTVDVWADINTRLLYQVHVSDTTNPAQAFVNLGLDYKGGISYPFFISGQSEDNSSAQTYSATITLNTKTNAVNLNLSAADNSKTSPFSIAGDFTIQPSNDKVTVAAPANAEPVTDVLNSLGLGSYLTDFKASATNTQTTATPQKPTSPADQAKLANSNLMKLFKSGTWKTSPAMHLVRFVSEP